MTQYDSDSTPRATGPGLGRTRLRNGRDGADRDGAPNPVQRWNGRVPTTRAGRRSFLAARAGWIVTVTLAVMLGAALFSSSRTPTYSSSADVLVQPRIYAAGTPPLVPDMGSEKALATSGTVLTIASGQLHIPVAEVASGLSVSVPLNTRVLHFAASSPNRFAAHDRAQAVASAYVSYWLAQQLPVNTTGAKDARVGIVPTAVITPASLPTSPSSPNHLLDLIIGAIIGLLLGVGTAYLRDRADDRLRGPLDLQDTGLSPVLAVAPTYWHLPGPLSQFGPVRLQQQRRMLAYADLATVTTRAMTQRGTRSILVTSPLGDAQATVSANLAMAAARAGQRVILVHTQAQSRHQHGGADPSPGLAEVIQGRASLADALHDGGIPGLQILPAGAVNPESRTLHAPELRQTLRRLTVNADLVVIDGPPVLAGADISTLAELAGVLLLVADASRTTRAQSRAAADQLRYLRGKLLGCVLEHYHGSVPAGPPRLGRRDLGHPAPPRPLEPAAVLIATDVSADAAHDGQRPANGWDHTRPTGKK